MPKGHVSPPRELGVRYIYRPWRRCPSTGRVLWARHYGLKAWRIPVVEDSTRGEPPTS